MQKLYFKKIAVDRIVEKVGNRMITRAERVIVAVTHYDSWFAYGTLNYRGWQIPVWCLKESMTYADWHVDHSRAMVAPTVVH